MSYSISGEDHSSQSVPLKLKAAELVFMNGL